MAIHSTHMTIYDGAVAVRTHPAVDTKGAVFGGAVAGLIGGVAMAMVAMIRAWAVGMGFWLPPKLMAGVFFGVEALIGDAGVIAAGLMVHMVMSAAFGALFGLVGGSRIFTGLALLGGLIYGVVVWGVMTFIGLPLINEVMRERMATMPVWWFVYHLVFGGMLLFTPPLARKFSGTKRPRV